MGARILKRLRELSLNPFGINLDEYLKREGRELVGLVIDSDAKEYTALFGDPPDQLICAASKSTMAYPELWKAAAGYRVNVGPKLNVSTSADVFLLNRKCLSLTGARMDGLMLHELTHCVIDSGQKIIARSDDDALVALCARCLGRFMDPFDTLHDERFFRVLVWACNQLGSGSERRVHDLLWGALRFDIDEEILTQYLGVESV